MSAIDQTETVVHLLRSRVDHTPDNAACHSRKDDGGWNITAWSALWRQAAAASNHLQDRGLSRGDMLAVMLPTGHEWLVTELAGMMAGAVIVGIDPHASTEQIEHIFRQAGIRAAVVDDKDALGKLDAGLVSGLKFVLPLQPCVDHAADGAASCWEQLTASADTDEPPTAPDISPDDPATLIFTSGTSGPPKGILYTHRQLIVACHSIGRVFDRVTLGDRMICWLPMAHLFQRMMNYFAIRQGAATYFVPDPNEVVPLARHIQPSFFFAVPRFYEKLHQFITARIESSPGWRRWLIGVALRVGAAHDRWRMAGIATPGLQALRTLLNTVALGGVRGAMGGRIRCMVTGTAPTPVELLTFFNSAGMPLLEAYGLTENTVPMAINRPGRFRFGSVGLPMDQNDIRFADDGELLVKGPGVFTGYLGDADSGLHFTDDGYYKTGDLGHADTDGFLYLVGRKSEIIKTSTGRRLSPRRIEAAYEASPYIDQAVVVGDGRKYPIALIALDERAVAQHYEGEQPNTRALIQRELDTHGASLSDQERVGGFAILPGPLSIEKGELTPTLKLKRKQIETNHNGLIESIYTGA